MPLPTPLSRRKKNVHKNNFGHVLTLAGSRTMLGASALTALSAIRSGCGLVTAGVPKSLNSTLQKKIANVIMTWPLNETTQQSFSASAASQVLKEEDKYDAIAIGPGLGTNPSTIQFVHKIIKEAKTPLVIDADALNALSKDISILTHSKTPKILTPHIGEFARLSGASKKEIEQNPKNIIKAFSQTYDVVLLLKGPRTMVAAKDKRIYINKTGNPGMATAGSGDVLTGMIAAFVAQGMTPFDAAKYGAYYHGKAGDLAAKKKTRTAMIASDIVDFISGAFEV